MSGVTLPPFQPLDKWGALLRVPEAAQRVLAELALAASAMPVFDTWIDNLDRDNDGNLLAAEDARRMAVRYAHIDHGSPTQGWRDGPLANVARLVGPYPAGVKSDGKTIGETIAAIEALSDAHIGAVVDRIPEAFINAQRMAGIRKGLCQRRRDLRGALAGLMVARR